VENLKVPFSYLEQQFPVRPKDEESAYYTVRVAAKNHPIVQGILDVVERGDFTLGKEVGELERNWSRFVGTEHAVGVASGTDALVMCLRGAGLGRGDRVIVPAYTFPSTINAVFEAGGIPVLVDVDERGILDWSKAVATAEERGADFIIPVWWAGLFSGIPDWVVHQTVIEDACQAIGARFNGQMAGSQGEAGAFSLHPLKNVNVWGDGGMVVSNSPTTTEYIKLARNNGIRDRDNWEMPGFNSRLDTVQAVVALHMLQSALFVNGVRRGTAEFYDRALDDVEEVTVPARLEGEEHSFHLYQVFAQRRDELVEYLNGRGIEAKVHYPKPVFLEPALMNQPPEVLGSGMFPGALRFAQESITIPCHQYLSQEQLEVSMEAIRDFYLS
jgi:aminotransferase EvaB